MKFFYCLTLTYSKSVFESCRLQSERDGQTCLPWGSQDASRKYDECEYERERERERAKRIFWLVLSRVCDDGNALTLAFERKKERKKERGSTVFLLSSYIHSIDAFRKSQSERVVVQPYTLFGEREELSFRARHTHTHTYCTMYLV